MLKWRPSTSTAAYNEVTNSTPLPVSIVQGQSALSPLGYQQITDVSASTALTVPTGATFAIVTAETQAVRFRDDGVAPSATVGMPIASGQSYTFSGATALAALRFFEQTSGAILNVSYYG